MRIAILGAGSVVSKSVLPYLLGRSDSEAILYTRSPDQLMRWAINRQLPRDRLSIESSHDFGSRVADAVVNFVGPGEPSVANRMGESTLALTAEWDQRVLQSLRKRPSTRYVFASSGVATGDDFKTPRKQGAPLKTPEWNDFYARAKAEAERRHRELDDMPIVDLRLYGFYGAEMGTELGYLVCRMVQKLVSRSILIADEHDIARDYLHPEDLSLAIMAVLDSTPVNAAYDLASLGPVRKFDLFRRFQKQFALQWEIEPSLSMPNKMNYYSEDFGLKKHGFVPRFSAVEAVVDQARAFLAAKGCAS